MRVDRRCFQARVAEQSGDADEVGARFTQLNGRGGIRVSIVRGGAIRVGDAIQILGLGDPIAED